MKIIIRPLILFTIFLLALNSTAQISAPAEKKAAPKPPSAPPPPPTNVYTVRTAAEFVDAIGSNRTIQLQSGATIYLPDAMGKSGSNYRFDDVYDGKELLIFGVTGLKIIGLGSTPVEIITEPVYGNVISFENCSNVSIENVNAGHGAEKGACTGGVFNIRNSNSFVIKNSIMYGSGMEGITTDNLNGLICSNSTIWGCTYSIMSIGNSSGVEFNNCQFRENGEYDQINIYNARGNVKFKSCRITGNWTGEDSYSDYALFSVSGGYQAVLENCAIQNNNTVYFANDASKLNMINTTVTGNNFFKGMYKN